MRITELEKTPSEVMAALHGQPFALWLDSADTSHPDARWSFVAASPLETITYKNGRITHKDADGRQSIFTHADPFGFVRERIAAFTSSRRSDGDCGDPCKQANKTQMDCHVAQDAPRNDENLNIPFTGGAAGYFGYELGRTLEALPESVKPSSTPDMAIGIYDQVFAYDHANGKGYLVTHGTEGKEQKFIRAVETAPAPPAYTGAPVDWQDEKTEEQYKTDIQTIINYIKAGEIYQANMTHRFESKKPNGFNSFAHYLQLRNKSAAPFAGYFNFGSGVLSSASPERFIRCSSDGEIETKPIKGTAPRSPDPIKDKESRQALQTSDKDRAENIMIVDLLRNDLSKCAATGSVQVPKLCAIESFSHVHHLVSTVTAYLERDKDALDLLKGAFPGGSITGAPKIRAQEIIDELESVERGSYCGALGYIGFDGAMDTNILIRTLVVEEDMLHFHVGGGIVADSDPACEYQETLDKAAGILASFDSLEEERRTSGGRQSPPLEYPGKNPSTMAPAIQTEELRSSPQAGIAEKKIA